MEETLETLAVGDDAVEDRAGGGVRAGVRGSGARGPVAHRARWGERAGVVPRTAGATASDAADAAARVVEGELLVLHLSNHVLRLRAASKAHEETLVGLVERLAAAHHAREHHGG